MKSLKISLENCGISTLKCVGTLVVSAILQGLV